MLSEKLQLNNHKNKNERGVHYRTLRKIGNEGDNKRRTGVDEKF